MLSQRDLTVTQGGSCVATGHFAFPVVNSVDLNPTVNLWRHWKTEKAAHSLT